MDIVPPRPVCLAVRSRRSGLCWLLRSSSLDATCCLQEAQPRAVRTDWLASRTARRSLHHEGASHLWSLVSGSAVMADDAAIRGQVVEGEIPISFSLAAEEVASMEQPPAMMVCHPPSSSACPVSLALALSRSRALVLSRSVSLARCLTRARSTCCRLGRAALVLMRCPARAADDVKAKLLAASLR